MPAAYLPVPQGPASEASAWIRQALSGARERFGEGVLAVAPELSDEQIAALAMYAEDFACRLLDACGFPGEAAVLRETAATGQQSEPGEDVPA
jgi:hypothetical protein